MNRKTHRAIGLVEKATVIIIARDDQVVAQNDGLFAALRMLNNIRADAELVAVWRPAQRAEAETGEKACAAHPRADRD